MRRSPEPSERQQRRVRTVTFAALLTFGLGLTTAVWAVAERDARDADLARREVALDEARGGIESFVAGVDDLLAETRLFAADTGYDASAFDTHAAQLVSASPMIEAVSLLGPDGEAVAGAGGTDLLAAVDAVSFGPLLTGHVRDGGGYRLGFVSGAGVNDVYVEVWVHTGGADTGERSFSLVLEDGQVLAGNAAQDDVVSGPFTQVVIGGVAADLYLGIDETSDVGGVSLPLLILFGGTALTVALAFALDGALRRGTLIADLVAEQSALGRALDEQRALEIELRRAQQQWEAVLRDSPDAIAVVTADHGLELLNRDGLLGHTASSLAEPEGLWQLLDVEDRRRFGWLATVSRSVHQRGEVEETAFALKRVIGEPRWHSIRLTSTDPEESGGPTQTIATITDIHDRWKRGEVSATMAVDEAMSTQ